MKRFALLLMTCAVAMTACKKNVESGKNPFFEEWKTPFGMPPLGHIKPEHYKPAYEEAIRQQNAEIEAIISNPDAPTFGNTILAMDVSGQMLSRVSGVFALVSGAESNEGLRAVEREMTPVLTEHADNISMNPQLFERVKAVYDNRAAMGLDALQERLLEKKYSDFVRSGALLSEEKKEELRRINTELSTAGVQFRNNLLADGQNFIMLLDEDDLSGLPSGIRSAAAEMATAAGHAGKYLFNLDNTSRIAMLTYADRRDLREQMYMGYILRGNRDDENDNKAVINEMVRLRLERANLLGYATFADFQLEQRMAKNTSNVYEFLYDMWTPSLAGAKREMDDMKAIMLRETGSNDFQGWDWWYYAEKVRKAKYDLDEEMTRPYFSLPKVQAGIFELCNRLYGITFEPMRNAPVYHPDVRVYEVKDIDGSHLGVFMMDMHPREGKRSGAWCGSVRNREFENGVQTAAPITYIVCNFTSPVGSTPSLLTLDEVGTFFHEMGHAIHVLFNSAPYPGLRRTEQDFIELPSQIMEHWAFEPEMLRKYAVHHRTGEIIPDDLIDRIQNSAYFNQGFIQTEFLASAFIDMDIHNLREDKGTIDINAFERRELNERRGMIDQIVARHRLTFFQHIFSGGYTAGYYSYRWAAVLDADAFEAFSETGDIFNREVATRFRREILEQGGSADGMTLFQNFRNRDPHRDYYLYSIGLKERPTLENVDVDGLREIVDAIDE